MSYGVSCEYFFYKIDSLYNRTWLYWWLIVRLWYIHCKCIRDVAVLRKAIHVIEMLSNVLSLFSVYRCAYQPVCARHEPCWGLRFRSWRPPRRVYTVLQTDPHHREYAKAAAEGHAGYRNLSGAPEICEWIVPSLILLSFIHLFIFQVKLTAMMNMSHICLIPFITL